MGIPEILLILFVVLLIIGPRHVANLGRALGHSVREFELEFGRNQRDEGLPGEKPDEKLAVCAD